MGLLDLFKNRPRNAEKFDAEGVQIHNERGHEIPDPTPMQPPLGYNRQPSLAQQMREMIMSHELAKAAAAADMETFEEADDFDIGDDFEQEKHSPYEANFDPMTPEERAALTSQGKDADRILTQAEKDALAASIPKPKKTSRAATSSAPVSEPPSGEDQSEVED